MSHFTRMQTRMVEKEYLVQALQDLGLPYEDSASHVRGYDGQRTAVDFIAHTRNPDYDIGFRKTGEAYEIVADWWGIRDVQRDQFLKQVTRRYAYHATLGKLEEQGFTLAGEEVQKDGQIHLVLRRLV